MAETEFIEGNVKILEKSPTKTASIVIDLRARFTVGTIAVRPLVELNTCRTDHGNAVLDGAGDTCPDASQVVLDSPRIRDGISQKVKRRAGWLR